LSSSARATRRAYGRLAEGNEAVTMARRRNQIPGFGVFVMTLEDASRVRET
jgi:hypothetical protein